MWRALQNSQRRVVTLRYSPCDDTPTAATVAITTGGVSLLICKYIFCCSVGDPKPDPDQQDPHVFGPPAFGSGSIRHRYGSGSLPFLINVLK
jgi:hypothetical protein